MTRWAWPFVLVSLLVAGLFAADAWLPLFPREPGRRLTELFLRLLLIAYMSVVVLIPLVLAVSVWLLIRARQRGGRRPDAGPSGLALRLGGPGRSRARAGGLGPGRPGSIGCRIRLPSFPALQR